MTSTDPLSGSDVASPEPAWSRAARCFDEWRDGEARALDDLVRLMSPTLWHLVRAYGLDRETAEDVVQTTWLALVRRRDSISEARAVYSWLTTTARREAWRVSKATSRTTATDDEILETRVAPTGSAESEVVAGDENRHLWEAVAQLNERCRRLLRVVAFDERPDYSSTAAELGMPVGSIGPTRGRCLAKLRDILAASGFQPPTPGAAS